MISYFLHGRMDFSHCEMTMILKFYSATHYEFEHISKLNYQEVGTRNIPVAKPASVQICKHENLGFPMLTLLSINKV